MSHRNSSLAATLGKGYAHVQHGMDRVIMWSLRQMRNAAKDDRAERRQKEGRVRRAARGIFSFVGTVGDSYYTTYEELKGKK